MVYMHERNMNIRISHHCNATAIRTTTADFLHAINECKCFLQTTPLDGSCWSCLIPIFAHKRSPPPWIDLVLSLRSNPQHVLDRISCITQIPLSVWQTMSVHEISSRIPGAPGAKGRFKAALHRFQEFRDVLTTFLRLQSLDATPKAHIVQPTWSGNETCFHCQKLMRFSAEPSKITRACPSPGTLSESVSSEWLLRFDEITAAIQRIIDLL